MKVEFPLPLHSLNLHRDIVVVPEAARIVDGVQLTKEEFARHMIVTGEWEEGQPMGSRTFDVKFNRDKADL